MHAVAGLENDKIAQRCQKLAEEDWSEFPVRERAAYLFARKQAKTPWHIESIDVQRLIDHFGPGTLDAAGGRAAVTL